jgi:hypothetical protein
MAVADKEGVQDTEAQKRLRQAIADIQRGLKRPVKGELTDAVDALERLNVRVRQELRQTALPLGPKEVSLLNPPSAELNAAEMEQQVKLEHGATLLELAREVRAQALVALYNLR